MDEKRKFARLLSAAGNTYSRFRTCHRQVESVAQTQSSAFGWPFGDFGPFTPEGVSGGIVSRLICPMLGLQLCPETTRVWVVD